MPKPETHKLSPHIYSHFKLFFESKNNNSLKEEHFKVQLIGTFTASI